MTKGLFRASTALIIASGAALACGTEPSQLPTPPPNVEITVSPALNGTFSGHSDSHQLTATITDTLGNPRTGVAPVWSVFPTGVGVNVSQAGLVTVAAQSQVIDYSIRATVEGITGSAILRVLPRPLGKLYFTRDDQLFVKNLADDLDATQLTTGIGLITGFDVDQADGLIFLSRGVGGNSDIFRMNLDGSGLTPLTTDGGRNRDPVAYAPTHEIYFSRREPGATVNQIWKMAADGTGRTQLTTGTQEKSFPVISSDGQRLAWVETFPGGNNEIVTSDNSGADPVRLTDRIGQDYNPFWLSNARLLWNALEGSNLDILATDLPPTGAPLNLTVVPTAEGAPMTGCLANTITFLSDRAGQNFDAFHLDLSNGLVVRYVLPTRRSMTQARRVCQ